jgi:hypothetical protein
MKFVAFTVLGVVPPIGPGEARFKVTTIFVPGYSPVNVTGER